MKRTKTKLTLHRETLRKLAANELIEVQGALPTTPIGNCTELEPCVSTARN